jgi:serine/threonine protein phosphatase PrpC
MSVTIAAHTDVGSVKTVNQDSYCIRAAETDVGDIAFVAVCDGMGGLDRGELASANVTLAFSHWFDTELPEMLDVVPGDGFLPVVTRWGELIEEQNGLLISGGKQCRADFGTTLTAFFAISGIGFVIAHVGDTRAYRIRDELELVTEDHTVVANEIKNGRMSASEAEKDPRRNVLLQCIGVNEFQDPLYVRDLSPPTGMYLLCSDGFRHEISEAEIYGALTARALLDEAAMKTVLKELADECIRRGEKDNITSVLINIV